MSDTLKPRTLAAFALAAALGGCGGGSNPLDNPPAVENPPGVGGQKLSYAYFQRCVFPIFLAQLPIHQGNVSSINTCAASGCHDNTNGTGGRFRVIGNAAVVDVTDPANTPDAIRATDMYKNFYSAQAATVLGAPTAEPLLLQAAGPGRPARRRHRLRQRRRSECQGDRLLDQPPGARGTRRVQHLREQSVHAARSDQRHVQHAMKGLAEGRGGLRIACLAGASLSSPRSPLPARAADEPAPENPKAERVTVTDPYIEIRTGPGPRLPDLLRRRARRADRHRAAPHRLVPRPHRGGKVGWVHRGQLETTLTAAGQQKSFRDVLVDDYLSRKLQIGFGYGQFKSEPMLKVWGSYRLSETLSIEATLGQVQGVFSGTDFWHVNLLAEPWSDQRPVAVLRHRRRALRNFPNLSLVDAETTSANLANAGVGVRYYLTDRFVLRADYSLYTVFVNDAKTKEYGAWSGRRLLLLLGPTAAATPGT
jgi:hypothetical protein